MFREMLPKSLQELYQNNDYEFNDLFNIFGVRSASRRVNKFDDFLCVYYVDDNGNPVLKQWAATTDPGLKVLKAPINSAGTAILKAGQYKDCYQLGKHKGKYQALVQTGGEVIVHRDADRDSEHDLESQTQSGYFGINIHKAGVDSLQVDGWSAGCQVFKRTTDFNEFMTLCKKFNDQLGGKFTYTLFSDIR